MFFKVFHRLPLSLSVGLFLGLSSVAYSQSLVDDSSGVERIERSETPRYEFSSEDDQFLNEIERGCFNYLWNEVGKPGGLAKDRRTTQVASLAGVGFQLSSLPIGIERGWITPEAGLERALTVLRTLRDAPGNRRSGVFLHFVNADDGKIYPPYNNEISTVDHTLFLAGAMAAATYFEGEVAEIVNHFAAETNWKEFQAETGLLSFAWKPADNSNVLGDGKLMDLTWHLATDEERLIYFIATGCPTPKFAIEPVNYYKLKREVGRLNEMPPFVLSWNGLLFTYFFSHCWIDYRSLTLDDPSQFGIPAPRVDWFENSRRATLAHHQRCIEFSDEFKTLAPDRWGLSPCMGQLGDTPGWSYIVQEIQPNIRQMDQLLGGTVAPYAAGSAIMFTPRESLEALRAFQNLKDKKGEPFVWRDPTTGGFAFADSFNLDQQVACDDNIAIDVGPMLLAIENVRTGLVWSLFMKHPHAQQAVERLKLKPIEKAE